VPERSGPYDRLLESEFRRLNAGVVTKRRPLQALLDEAEPRLETRDGEGFLLDEAVLPRYAAVTDPAERRALRLPINVHFTGDATAECYVSEELAAEVLRRLEGWEQAYPFREGRMWLPVSLAVDLIRRHGGAVQAIYL
jgi:uncharacterized protein (UPF0216 family)